MWYLNFILNQKGSPAFYSDALANRPAAGYIGRLFISTDTFEIYRDNGTTWDLIGGPGTGTITGTGTVNYVAKFSNTGEISDSQIFDNGTSVGFGTATPSALYRIDVSGAARITDNVLVNGVVIGKIANTVLSTNYVFGNDNLRSFTTGGSIIAIGNNVFDETVSGGTGIGIGYNVMDQANIFSNNIGIGFDVMRYASNNGNNIGIGSNIMSGFPMTGFANIAIGLYALWKNESGYQNTAIGIDSLQENTTGYFNTAIGEFAISSNTTGYANTALGRRALSTVTTGINNIAIGNLAGGFLSTNGPTTGSRNIFIGSDTLTTANNHDNEIVIGYGAIGAGSNTITFGNTSVVNTYLKGVVNSSSQIITKSNSGIAVSIVDTANGNALNIDKTGSGFAINVAAGVSNFNTQTNLAVTSGNVYVGTANGTYSFDVIKNLATQAVMRLKNESNQLLASARIFAENDSGAILQAITFGSNFGTDVLGLGQPADNYSGIFVSGNTQGLMLATLAVKPILFGIDNTEVARISILSNFLIRNNIDNGIDALQVTGSIYTSTTIQTGNPLGGTAAAWKLGSIVTGGVVLDVNSYIELEVNGVTKKLLVST